LRALFFLEQLRLSRWLLKAGQEQGEIGVL